MRDPTFSRFDTIPACGTQTADRQTRDDGYYPRIACAARVKTAEECTVYRAYLRLMYGAPGHLVERRPTNHTLHCIVADIRLLKYRKFGL